MLQSNLNKLVEIRLLLWISLLVKPQKEEKLKVKGLENEIHIDANELLEDDKILVELFNNHYINIVDKTSGLCTKLYR